MTPPLRRRPGTLLLPGVLAVLLLAPLVPASPASPAGPAAAAPAPVTARDLGSGQHDHGEHDDGEHDHGEHDHGGAGACPGELLPGRAGEPTSCAHADEPPPGVDVTDPVSTSEAVGRDGAVEAAFAAAGELGAPGVVEAAAAATVPCDGDGTSGYRVQAMYVVEVGRPNRYAELLPSLKAWAAGTGAVVNRSAALTGGVRDVRFVHAPGTGACDPVVLNVTVPAGATAGFGQTISAVQAQGHGSPARKYLMWTDANVLCGIANTYLDDQPGQGNANNGLYPQYSRIDAGCWGGTYSVEAHELVHNLGGVQRSAPHSTAAGHCRDESDRLCYVDGAGVVMQQVCPGENEALLDCGADDYFSTFPSAGSYLDTRWNSADSRFLVGGGDGADGGQAGAPTRLGVSVQVNSPGVPGLPTQATAALQLPAGRTAGVVWTSSRADCVLGSPSALQTSVTCPATTTSPVTVTATATDSTAQKAVASSPLTFTATTRRASTVAVDVAGATGTASGCTGAPVPVRATVLDVQSGLPVLGTSVTLLRRSATSLAATAGLGRTLADGTWSLTSPVVDGQLWSARAALTGPFDASATTADVLVRAEACSATVTLQAASSTAWAGDTLAFSGTAVRTTAGGVSSPVAGGTVTLLQTPTGSTTPRAVGTARTDAAGAWAVSPVVLATGPVRARLSAAPGNPQADSAPVALTVTPSTTRLTASATPLTTPYGTRVVVSGTLRRDEAGALTPVAAARVQVSLTRPGTTTATVLGAAVTDAAGGWTLPVTATLSGSLSAAFAAVPAQPAASTPVGELTVTSWTTTTTMTAGTTTTLAQGATVTSTGTVTRDAGTGPQPAPALPLRIVLQPAAGGAEVLLAYATTRADGTYTVTTRPTQSGTLRARVVRAPGHGDSASQPVPVTVAAGVAAVPSTRTPRVGTAFTVRAAVTPAQVATVRLQASTAGGAWTEVASATTGTAGTWTFTVTPASTGSVQYRVAVDATARNAAATSPAVPVTVGP